MGHTLTIRLTEEPLSWLKEKSRITGISMGRLVRDQTEKARLKGQKRFMRHYEASIGNAFHDRENPFRDDTLPATFELNPSGT